MNWMTSAKNRIQRSKKKKEDNLRMIASCKLAPQHYGAQCKKSVILHDFSGREPLHDTTQSVLRNNGQSNDVFMLNNLTRARALAVVDQECRVPNRSLSVVKPASDPLALLEVSPPKALRHDSIGTHQEPEEQSIQYYNNGELCDELGRLIIAHSSLERELFPPSSSTLITAAAAHTGVISRTNSNSFDSASPLPFLDVGTHDEWWLKMIAMLDGAKVDPALLRVVVQELCASQCTVPNVTDADVGYARSTLRDMQVPYPREALKGLYSALSKVGQDPKASLVVFDVIRMVEQVDKQQKDQQRDLCRERCSGTSSTRATTMTPAAGSSTSATVLHTCAHSRSTAYCNAVGTTKDELLCLEDILPTATLSTSAVTAAKNAVSSRDPRPNQHSTSTRDASTRTHTLPMPTLPSRDFWADFCPPQPAAHQQPQQHLPQPTQSRAGPPADTVGGKRKAMWSNERESGLFSDKREYRGVHVLRSGTNDEPGDEELRLEDLF